MGKILGIFGAGGLGREYLETAEQYNSQSHKYKEMIFIADVYDEKVINGKRVFNLEQIIQCFDRDDLEIVVAIGEPMSRNKIIKRITELNITFATLIHPNAVISDTVTIGKGCYIGPFSFLSCNVQMGNHVLIQPHTTIGHDSVLGNNVVISSMNALSGHVTVGDNTYIGVGTSVIQGGTIGKNTIIGMGSVVTRDIPDEVIAMGNPARAMRRNENHKVFG